MRLLLGAVLLASIVTSPVVAESYDPKRVHEYIRSEINNRIGPQVKMVNYGLLVYGNASETTTSIIKQDAVTLCDILKKSGHLEHYRKNTNSWEAPGRRDKISLEFISDQNKFVFTCYYTGEVVEGYVR
jgi:hypothetical protein